MTHFKRRSILIHLASLSTAAIARSATALPHSRVQVDFAWDGRRKGHRDRPDLAWWGRVTIPDQGGRQGSPRPLVVFLHGLNKALIKHRWMGGGHEGDVRAIVEDLVDKRAIAPPILAAPSSTVAAAVSRGASWRGFDLAHFIEAATLAASRHAQVDRSRVIVAGHSGAGCSPLGGIEQIATAGPRVFALLAIDTCMAPSMATALARAHPETHVVVAYQRAVWADRPFRAFARAFRAGVKRHPARDGVLRELDLQTPPRAPHDQTVPMTLNAWLPRLIPPH